MPQSFARNMSTESAHIEMKKKLSPKLRFKEFQESWNRILIQKLIDDGLIISHLDGNHGGLYPRSEEFASSGVPYITANDFINGRVSFESCKFLPFERAKQFRKGIAKSGDVLFAHNATVGPTAILETKFEYVILSTTATYFRCDNENLLNHFLKYSFETKGFVEQYTRVMSQSTRNQVPITTQRKFTVVLPVFPEQQKIASFLSAVDEKIQQFTRKKELLEQYKKGVMQQLFSGKLRFKDENGKAYPKWEEKLFEDIYSFYSTNSLSRDKLNYHSGSVKNIHYGDIHTKFSSQFIVSEEYVPYINNDVDLSKVKDESYCRDGDLVIADASEDYNDIGKSIELVKLNDEKVVAGLHTFLARPDLAKIRIGFSGYLVQAPYVRMQVKKIAQGSKVLSLSPGRLGKIALLIPCKEEQQKIANFLSAIDSKIESVSIQIENTQTFKKGLLQQMFV
jgi:type I restriction enzyme S subunit